MGAIPPSSRGPLAELQVDLSASQIATLDSVPVTLLAQQGAGTAIVPINGSFQYKPGTVAFAATTSLSARVGSNGGVSFGDPLFNTLVAKVVGGIAAQGTLVANTALVLSTGDPIGFTGPILTSSLGAGGSGYAAGNTGTVNGGATLAAYVVDTVDGGGAVLTYHLTAAGQGYAVANGVVTTVVTGGGDGAFTINILTITNASNGTGRVTVLYYLMPLR